MPNPSLIITNSGIPSLIPNPDFLSHGEITLNWDDGILYFKDAENEIRTLTGGDITVVPYSIEMGTVITADYGASANASISGTAPNQSLNLTIPAGAIGPIGLTGPAGLISSSTKPTNTSVLWSDYEEKVFSVWNGSVWVEVVSATPAQSATVSVYTDASNVVINGMAYLDETIYLNSSAITSVNSVSLILPSASESRIGQVKTFISSKPVTVLTITITDGDEPIHGSPLTSAIAYDAYSFQYVSTGVWLRLA